MNKLLMAGFFFWISIPAFAQVRGSVQSGANSSKPTPVRNDVAQADDEIITIRTFRIKKGAFPQFLKASQEDVWPYFEKIGSRVIGMWLVFQAEGVAEQPAGSKDYDEVYLSTRYASLDHWKATRDASSLGGNGPDWEKCQRGLALRRSLTISTSVTFLKGSTMPVKPYYMPGLKESYEKKP